MNDWLKIKKKERKYDIYMVVFSILGLGVGILLDILVRIGIVLHVVEQLDAFSLTLLQLQGSVVTLTIAILALLAGNISDSYLGVSITEFCLDIRPAIFKQRIIIMTEFALLGVSIISYLWKFYNLVIFAFVVSVILILCSISKIYLAFKGKKFIQNEIIIYTKYLFESDKSNALNAATLFVNSWKDELLNQTDSEYKCYVELLRSFSQNLLDKHNDIKVINDVCKVIALSMLQNQNENIQIKGIDFVEECYEILWEWILQNKDKTQKISGSFQLLSGVSREWYKVIEHLPAEVVEDHLNWKLLTNLVIKVSCHINFASEKANMEIFLLLSIARKFGKYIDNQNRKGNIINKEYWSHLFADSFRWKIYDVPSEAEDFYGESLALVDFNLCYGYILSGDLELVKEGIFLDDASNIYQFYNANQLFRILVIHLFMYYLGFVESKDCVDIELQKEISTLLVSPDIVRIMKKCLSTLVDSSDLLTIELEQKLEKTLHDYEMYPKHSNVKMIVSPYAARDYFLYIVLYTNRYFWKQNGGINALDQDTYFTYLLEDRYGSIKSRLLLLSELFSVDKESKSRERWIDKMLSVFFATIKNAYKSDIVKKAAEDQQVYELNKIQQDLQTRTNLQFKKVFSDFFSGIISNTSQELHFKNILVYRCNNITRYLNDENQNEYLENGLAFWVGWLIFKLIELKYAREYIRSESDDEFRNYIKEKGYDILIGSHYSFSEIDYDQWEAHKEFLEQYDCRFTDVYDRGLALKKGSLCICLENVTTKIYSPTLELIGINSIKENGLYVYEPTEGVSIEFEEHELREYIHNERKFVDIYIDVSISMDNQRDASVIIRNENYE